MIPYALQTYLHHVTETAPQDAQQTALNAPGGDAIVHTMPLRGRKLGAPGSSPGASGRGSSAKPWEPSVGQIPAFVAGQENELVFAIVNHIVEFLGKAVLANTKGKRQKAERGSLTVALGGLPAEHAIPSPIVLTGPAGSGKTHLARGLVELWQSVRGEADAAYYTAADFARELAAAIQQSDDSNDAVAEFRNRCRGYGLLVIEDVDRLGDSAHRREELRQTLDGITEREGAEQRGLVIVTAPAPLASAESLDRPLLSRLAGGLVLEIAPPGLAARRELLRHAAAAVGCSLQPAALETLAENLPAEPPQLLRAAVELRRRGGTNINVRAVEQLLAGGESTGSPPLRDIVAVVARYYRLPQRQILSASRKQSVVAARAMVIYLARELTPLSYEQIGKSLGGRDHTTIMHSYRRVRDQLPEDRALRSAAEELKRLIGG